jgi:carbamoyltransferase
VDALACFLATGIDYLALQDMLIAKNQFHSIISPFTRAFSEVSTIVRTGLSAEVQAGGES